MTYGTALGWPAPVLVKISTGNLPFTLDPSEISWMVSIIYVTNLLTPLPAAILMDALGRKRSLILLTLPALIAWPCALLANNVKWLYLSRLLLGIQGAAGTTISPTYISEISSAQNRGALNTLGMFFCFLGIFYSYTVGHLVSYPVLCFLNGLIPVTSVILSSLVPDTPYWYVMKKRHLDAAKSLSWLRGCLSDIPTEHQQFANKKSSKEGPPTTTNHTQNELYLIEQGVHQQLANRNSFGEILQNHLKALTIVVALTFTQRMSGFGSLLPFGATILPDLGWISGEQCNIIVGGVWMLAIPLAGVLMDIFGRKPLILVSSFGIFVSMTIIGGYFYFGPHQFPLNYIPFIFTLTFSFLFSIGIGPIALLLPSELFPANVKAKASAIASMCQGGSAFLSNIIWLDVIEYFGVYMNFFIFAVVSLVFFVFSIYCFIETKGKTLEEIQEELNSERLTDSA